MSTSVFGASFWVLPSAKRWIGCSGQISCHEGTLRLRYQPFTDSSRAYAFYQRSTTYMVVTAQKKEALAVTSDDDYEDDDYVPFAEMKRWKTNKPSGFGDSKTYDTSLEERLLAEIEQSKKKQIANVKKMKNKTVNNVGKVKDVSQKIQQKEQQQQNAKSHDSEFGNYSAELKSEELVPIGVNVRIGNLPKKKNIVRDLQAAFKGCPGLLHINPVVSGNKKTRDPVCKGLAFLVFRSEDSANRFAMKYNGQSIIFGKIERSITCSLSSPSGVTNPDLMSPAATNMHTMPRLRIRDKGFDLVEPADSRVSQQEKENDLKSSVTLEGACLNILDHENSGQEKSSENMAGDLVKHGGHGTIAKDEQDTSDARFAFRTEENSLMASLNDDENIVMNSSKFYEDTDINEKYNIIHQNDAQRVVSSHQDSGKEAHYSDDRLKSSDDILDEIAGRELKNVVKSVSSNVEFGKLDSLESIQVEQEPPRQGLTIVKNLRSQTLGSKAENLGSKTPNVEFSVLASRVNEQSQRQKGRKKKKNKVEIETKPMKETAAVLGSGHRLKKKERSMLTDVLVKYGGGDSITTS